MELYNKGTQQRASTLQELSAWLDQLSRTVGCGFIHEVRQHTCKGCSENAAHPHPAYEMHAYQMIPPYFGAEPQRVEVY